MACLNLVSMWLDFVAGTRHCLCVFVGARASVCACVCVCAYHWDAYTHQGDSLFAQLRICCGVQRRMCGSNTYIWQCCKLCFTFCWLHVQRPCFVASVFVCIAFIVLCGLFVHTFMCCAACAACAACMSQRVHVMCWRILVLL